MNFKTSMVLVSGIVIGIGATCTASYFYSKSLQNKLAVVMQDLDQSTATNLAEALPDSLSKRVPIVMASLWKNAAIGTSAKNLYPNLVESLEEIEQKEDPVSIQKDGLDAKATINIPDSSDNALVISESGNVVIIDTTTEDVSEIEVPGASEVEGDVAEIEPATGIAPEIEAPVAPELVVDAESDESEPKSTDVSE
jgi:hypothetical protein